MSEPGKPDSDKLNKLFFNKDTKPVEPETTDRDWVNEQLEPVAGDRVICELTDAYVDRFVAAQLLDLEFIELQNEFRKRIAEARMKAELKDYETWEQLSKAFEGFSVFRNEDEAEETFKLHGELAFQLLAFWHDVRTEFNVWGEFLDVRHGFIVVSTGKKYKL